MCSFAQGYGGSACDQCVSGFAPASAGACVKYEAVMPSGDSAKSPTSTFAVGSLMFYVVVGGGGAIVIVAIAVGIAVFI
ncbi:MAG: hypothetical protein ACK56I_15755, partial [bacterium]